MTTEALPKATEAERLDRLERHLRWLEHELERLKAENDRLKRRLAHA